MRPYKNKRGNTMVKAMFLLSTLALILAPPLSPLAAPDNSLMKTNDSSGESSLSLSSEEGKEVVGLASTPSSKHILKKANRYNWFRRAKTQRKKRTLKPCRAGYFRDPYTKYCRKITTVTETRTMITTVTYDVNTGRKIVQRVCKSGYWWNRRSGRCNKKANCGIGYRWDPATNYCRKIRCQFGYRVQDTSNICRKIVCLEGHILNQKTGNCVVNRHGTFKECRDGWTLDLRTLRCALIGTKGSNDPRSIAAKRSQKAAPKLPKVCPADKFLNPKTNRCKKRQEVHETSTSKTITTYDPATGEATVEKVCKTGFHLNMATKRCLKEKTEKTSKKSNQNHDHKTPNLQDVRNINSDTKSGSSDQKTKGTNNEAEKTKGEKICKVGYVLNPNTNRCNKEKPEKKEKVCKTGYILNPATNRCKKEQTSQKSAKNSSDKTCPEGKALNPKTNRCKNLETITESTTGKTITTFDPKTGQTTTKKICHEGYELSVETNRCKKVKQNKGASNTVEVPKLGDKPKENFIATGSIIGVASIGTGVAVLGFRHEIISFLIGLFKKS